MSKNRVRLVGEKIYPFAEIKEFFKVLVNNDSSYENDDIDAELNDIKKEQDNGLIMKYEKAVTTNGNKAGGKKSERINVKATKKEVETKSIEDKLRDEER
ncbi:MAG: hypothetical protein IKF17_02680 [Clostridia bacterium]|nr:hypothetical protein [Clostridia bacterium]